MKNKVVHSCAKIDLYDIHLLYSLHMLLWMFFQHCLAEMARLLNNENIYFNIVNIGCHRLELLFAIEITIIQG